MLNTAANDAVCNVATLINKQREMLKAKELKEFQRTLVDCIAVLSSSEGHRPEHHVALERLWEIETYLTRDEGAW